MRLVFESLNELMSFEKHTTPLGSLGIGLRTVIEKWLNDHHEQDYTINDNDTVSILTDRHFGDSKVKIPFGYFKAILYDEFDDENLVFNTNAIRYLFYLDYALIDVFIKLFPDQRDKIIKIAKNVSS